MVGVKKKASPLLHRASKHSSKPKLVEGTPTYELEHKTALWQGVGLGLVVVLTVQFRLNWARPRRERAAAQAGRGAEVEVEGMAHWRCLICRKPRQGRREGGIFQRII